ncbi:MAG: YdbH domain-containing protein [Kiloniellaceae bacterium]
MRVLLAFGLLLIAAAGGAALFREDIATRGAIAYLEGQGIEVRALTVTRLTPGGIEISDVVLGTGQEVALARLVATPALDGLAPSVSRLEIEGLRLRLDITGEAPLLGSLQPAFDRLTGGAAESAPGTGSAPPLPEVTPPEVALPEVALHDAQVILTTPSGPITADLAGRLGPDDRGGLRAEVALRLDSDLGRLRADLAGSRGADGALRLDAEIAEGRFAWEGFALGDLRGRLALGQSAEGEPRLEAAFDLGDLAYAPPDAAPLRLARGRLTAEGGLAAAALALTLEGDGEYVDLTAEARRGATGSRQDVAVSLQGELRTAGGLAQFLPLPGPQVTAGTLVLDASGTGDLPEAAATAAHLPALLGLLAESRLSLSGDAILGGVAVADGSSGISGHLPLAAELGDDTLDVTLRDDAALRVERPARDSLAALGVPEDLLPLLASGLNLTLESAGELPFHLKSRPAWPPRSAEIAVAARAASDQGVQLALRSRGSATLGDGLDLTAFSGSLDGRAELQSLALGGREARSVVVALPLTADYDTAGLRLALARPGELRIQQFGAGAPLRLEKPLSLAVKALSLDTAPDTASYSYALEATQDAAALAIGAGGTEALDVAAEAVTLKLAGRFERDSGHAADLDVGARRLALPGHEVAAEAARVTVALDRELRPQRSRFSVGSFSLGGSEPLTAPLALDGSLQRAGRGYDIAGEVSLSGGQVLADLTGRYDDAGTASLTAESRLLAFVPDGLQPAAVSPLLAGLEEVRGNLTASARLAWPRDPAAESGRLNLANLAFKSAGIEVAGLNLDLALAGLQPLASAPGQRLTLRSLDAGVPVENIALVFSLDQAPRPHLTVEDGGFDLGGARWRLAPTELDPAAARNRVVLSTEGLDLATFFDLIEIDGLSGSGRLKGSLPVVFAGEDVIVDDGHFEALEPGRLSIRIQALRSALAGGGETVEMAVKVLEDFHYDELTLDIAKSADHDAIVRLSILGQNPEVMEGHPFRFNINLESNLTSLLAALRQGYSLSDDALRRAWQLR